jgi:exonuclease VII large subunit
MLETFKDYLTAFIGIVLLLIPLIKEAKKSGDRKSKGYMAFLIVSCVILLILGFDKINRDKHEKKESIAKEKESDRRNTESLQKITSLETNVSQLASGRKADSLAFSEFVQSLEKKYMITRDAKSNQPITYTTNIKNAQNVNIGRD